MKWKIIGYTYQDDIKYKFDNDITVAKTNALIHDIVDNGYLYSGYEYQESHLCCPVLNNGLKMNFTRRGFAGVMAIACGDTLPMDYAHYVEYEFINPAKRKTPITPVLDYKIVDNVNILNETYEITYNERIVNDEIILNKKDCEFIDKGDIVYIKNLNLYFTVTDVKPFKATDEQLERYMKNRQKLFDDYNTIGKDEFLKQMKIIDNEYNNIPDKLIITLNKKTTSYTFYR